MASLGAKTTLVAALLIAAGLAGCEKQGPLERMGESMDEAIEETSDAIEGEGPLEKAGEKIDETVGSSG